MSSFWGIKLVTLQSRCFTVRSSAVSPSGKLQLHISEQRNLQSLSAHRVVFSTLLPNFPSKHNWTVWVPQTLTPCRTHPLCYWGRITVGQSCSSTMDRFHHREDAQTFVWNHLWWYFNCVRASSCAPKFSHEIQTEENTRTAPAVSSLLVNKPKSCLHSVFLSRTLWVRQNSAVWPLPLRQIPTCPGLFQPITAIYLKQSSFDTMSERGVLHTQTWKETFHTFTSLIGCCIQASGPNS